MADKETVTKYESAHDALPRFNQVVLAPVKGVFWLVWLTALGALLAAVAYVTDNIIWSALSIMFLFPGALSLVLFIYQVHIYNRKLLGSGRYEYRERQENTPATRQLPTQQDGSIPYFPRGFTQLELDNFRQYVSRGNTTISGRPLANAGVLNSKDDKRLIALKDWLKVEKMGDSGHSGAMELNEKGRETFS